MNSPISEELETQYNARAAVPEHVEIMAHWRERSVLLRERGACRLDLPYGEQPRERIDYFESGQPHAPLIVFLHGGYWQRGDKSTFSFVAESLLEAGVNVALAGYSLCPDVALGEIVVQVRCACAWLWRHAAELGHDPERLYVSGNSAGGHLAAMAVATRWAEFEPGLPADLMKGGLAISGLFELEPLIHTSLNEAIEMDTGIARSNSPVLLSPAPGCALTVAVGELESAEFHRQADVLVRAWGELGATVASLRVAGCNHFTIVDRLAVPDGELLQAMLWICRA